MSESQEAAERLLLGACLNKRAEQVWTRGIEPLMFDPGERQRIAEALHLSWVNGDDVDVQAIGLQSGSPVETFNCYQHFIGGGLEEAVLVVRNAHEGRLLRASAARVMNMLDAGVEPEAVKERIIADVSTLPSEGSMASHSLADVLAMEEEEKRWVIPGVLAMRERMILTGNEGAGKSMLMAQIAVCAAHGLNPFDPLEKFEPRRVLVLDVENDHETQVAPKWRTMSAVARQHSDVRDPHIELAAVRDIDLFDPIEANEFIRLCVRSNPDLVIMGSLYKLTSSSEEHERFARAVQSTIDRIRARVGAAVIVEGHAGHGMQGDRNGGRPDGSSLWLRWPELGIWLRPWRRLDDNPRRVHRLSRWRGDRVVRDNLPYAIEMGGVMPWHALDRGEFDARYGD